MPTCLHCSRPAVHRHHPTMRVAPGGHYLDGAFTVPLCQPCHAAEHVLLHDLGADRVLPLLLARPWRTAILIGRLADESRPIPADVLLGLHDVLAAHVGDVRRLIDAGVLR